MRQAAFHLCILQIRSFSVHSWCTARKNRWSWWRKWTAWKCLVWTAILQYVAAITSRNFPMCLPSRWRFMRNIMWLRSIMGSVCRRPAGSYYVIRTMPWRSFPAPVQKRLKTFISMYAIWITAVWRKPWVRWWIWWTGLIKCIWQGREQIWLFPSKIFRRSPVQAAWTFRTEKYLPRRYVILSTER